MRAPVLKRDLQTDIRIHATPAEVWRVLTDVSGWSQWNPTIGELSARGGLRPGNRVRLSIDLGRGIGVRRITAKLQRVEAVRELSWTGGIPGVALAHHWFRLESVPGGVVFHHGESMRGLAVPMVWPIVAPRLVAGYRRMNEALRERCEAS